MLKYVDLTVLSETFICQFTLNYSEKVVSGNWYLAGSHVSKRSYQRLPYLTCKHESTSEMPGYWYLTGSHVSKR
jgi:hypothetical protein